MLKKQSTLDQDFQNSNNQLKFSIESLLSNLPNNNLNNLNNKQSIKLDTYQKINKYDHHHHSENNNNCLDFSCFSYKSSIKNWINFYNLHKQNSSFDFNSKLRETIFNQPLNQQLNQQQLNSSINASLNQSQNNGASTIQTTATQIPSTQTPMQLTQHTQLPITSTNLNFNSNKQKLTFNQTSAQQQINSYINNLNSLNSLSTSTNAGGKMTQSLGNKKKRNRTIFTEKQLERLEFEFGHAQYMVGHDRLTLAAELELSEVQVKVWFQNRRIKFRRGQIDGDKKTCII